MSTKYICFSLLFYYKLVLGCLKITLQFINFSSFIGESRNDLICMTLKITEFVTPTRNSHIYQIVSLTIYFYFIQVLIDFKLSLINDLYFSKKYK